MISEIQSRHSDIDFSPDGSQLVTGNVNGDEELWDVGSGKKERNFQGHLEQVWSALQLRQTPY